MKGVSSNSAFSISLVFFVFYVIAFSLVFDADVRGMGDALRGIDQFKNFYNNFLNIDLNSQFQSRIVLAVVAFGLFIVLVAAGLIRKWSAAFFLAWPYSAYLITKIKLEFFVFPLMMIRVDTSKKQEFSVLAILTFAYVVTSENNILVLVFYRLMQRVFTALEGSKKILFFIAVVAFSLLIDFSIERFFVFFPDLAVYNHTRNEANPDYSILETVFIFYSSMNLSVWFQTDWVVHFFFMLLISFFFVLEREKLKKILFDARFYALMSTVIFFTSVTHAFQNSRYYYFFLDQVSDVGKKYFLVITLLGFAHSVFLIVRYL